MTSTTLTGSSTGRLAGGTGSAQLAAIGYLAKISSIRLNAFSAAAWAAIREDGYNREVLAALPFAVTEHVSDVGSIGRKRRIVSLAVISRALEL